MAGTVDLSVKISSDDYPTRRKEAARWLRKTVGVVVARDLPSEPSEKDFLQGLRSGMIICNLLNKVKPGAIPKIVEAPSALLAEPDADALAKYYENIRNFLVAVEDLGLPSFEFDDLEEGGDFSKVVDCLLALKSLSELKKFGGSGSRKFSGPSKSSPSAKSFNRATTPVARTPTAGSDKAFDALAQSGNASDKSDAGTLFTIVCDLLEDKDEEDIPIIVENILKKLTEEFESRLLKRIQTASLVGLATIETPRTPSEATKPLNEGNDDKEAAAQKAKKEEQDRINREKELLAQQEKDRKQEEERAAREEQERLEREEQERLEREERERIQREKEEQERLRKEEEERLRREEEERLQREEEERLRREEEERLRREEEERLRREEEERLRREEEERLRREEEERLRREEEERLRREEEERLRREEEERLRREEEERLRREEEERLRREEEERLRREEEERLRREEEERIRREEEERIRREEEERLRKEEEERLRREEEERLRREEEERIRREEEERIRRRQEERQRKKEERLRKKEEARLRREEAARLKMEKAERIRKAKEDRERRKREREEMKKASQEEKERLKKEKELRRLEEKAKRKEERRLAREAERLRKEKELQEEQDMVMKEHEEEERAVEEQERLMRELELQAIQENAKREEMKAAKEQERKNIEDGIQALKDKARKLVEDRKAAEEEDRILKEKDELAEKERVRKKEEYCRRMDDFNRLHAKTEKTGGIIQHQHTGLLELKNTLSTAKTGVQSMQKDYLEEADNLGTHVRNVCQAAAGYKKVLEENRKLYNQVQDLKGNIRIYCRVRPFLPGQENCATSVDYTDDDTVAVIVPLKNGKEGRKVSMFTKVFGPTATQDDVFGDTQPLVRSVLDGFNVCIFAYGQTGSGKTYTLTGPSELDPETVGVNYRALKDLFLISEERKDDTSYEISVNMVEIYNDDIRDLLVTDGSNKIVEIHNGKTINLPDANLVPVTSTEEIINLINLSKKNRAVTPTDTDDGGSRSHIFLTVHVVGKDRTTGAKTRGCMHLVDLAGSETIDDSDDESQISKSLSSFGDVMVSLALKSSKINYKNSKLTQLLQDALGAQTKILVFVHVHPALDEALETVNTLKFIERFSTVEGGAGKSGEVRELKEQIALLKSALAKRDGGEGQPLELKNSSSLQDLQSADSPKAGDLTEDEDESKKGAAAKKPAAGAAASAKGAKPAAAPKKKGK